ncbi:MAG: hypothetical protein JWN43_2879 [Gammaproteobacteria bacterium]|nr:hypothetical protein [Gammaproteobacteria bacterium]
MSRRRFTLLLIAALVAMSGAYYLSTQRNAPRETQGGAVIPSLATDMNAVTAVAIRKGSAKPTLTVHKTGTQWSVAERADYPADVAKLRRLLLSLRDARIVEEKTSDPARFAVIGVEDPVDPGAAGTEVTVVTPSGQQSLIVGKMVGAGNFVRRAGENRSYSVEPAIAVETRPRDWIDARLIDVPAAQIQRIEVKPATGAAYALQRLSPSDDSFKLDGVPAGRKALDGRALAPPATTFSSLTAEDVAAAADVDFAGSSQVAVTLSDGNVLTLTGTAIADKHWLQVKSTKDPELASKTQGRAFEVASYRYDALFKPIEQLLVPQDTAAGKPAVTPRPKGQLGTKKQAPTPAP